MADITVVNNVTRAIPEMVNFAKEMRKYGRNELKAVIDEYSNKDVIREALKAIADYVTSCGEV